MSKSVVALFRNAEEAQTALADLSQQGFQSGDVSLVAHESSGAGAGTGAAIGSAAGLMLGLAALAIPGIGPIVAAGPMAAALTGAGIGAAAGGMLGSLVELGVPHGEAGYFAEGVRRGGTLLVVHCNDDEVDRAERILNRNGAQDIDERVDAPKHVRVYDSDRSEVPDPSDEDYQRHFDAHFQGGRNSYNDYAAAYRYGATTGKDARYTGREWSSIETELQAGWEQQDQPGTWDKMKDAVQYGWNHVRGRA